MPGATVFKKFLKPSVFFTKGPQFHESSRGQNRGFLSLLHPVTFGLLLSEHPQLRGRRRQPLVTRIPLESEPSWGCQVSPGGWLINRTFPLLNLRRMEGIDGQGNLASCALAHEAVSWAHLPLQLSIPPARSGLIGDTCSLVAVLPAPRALLGPSSSSFPSFLCHASFYDCHFSLLSHSQVRRCHSSSPKELTFCTCLFIELICNTVLWPRWAWIIFS